MRRSLSFFLIIVLAMVFAVEKREEPTAVAISEDGRYVAVGTGDSSVWVWDIESPRLLKIFDLSSGINSMDFTQGGKILVVGEEDGTFDVLNVETGGIVQSVKISDVPVVKVKTLKGGRYVAIVRKDGTFEVWDSNGWWRFLNVNTSFENPDDIEVTDRYVVAVRKNVVKVWSLISSKLVNTIPLDFEAIDSDVTMGERNIVIAGIKRDGSIRVYVFDTLTGLKVADLSSLPGLKNGLIGLKAFPDASILVGVGKDGVVRIWDLTSMELTEDFEIGRVDLLAFTSDGMVMVTARSDWKVDVWRMKGTWVGKVLRRFPGDVKDIDFISSEVLVSGYKLLSILDDEGKDVLNIRQTGYITSASFDPESGMLISGSKKGYVKIWNGSNGDLLQVLWKHDLGVIDVLVVGKKGYSVSEDGELAVWDVVKGERIGGKRLDINFSSASFSKDGEVLVAGDIEGDVILYDTDGNVLWKRERAHEGVVSAVAVSNNFVVSGDEFGNVKLWTRDGELVMLLRGKLGRISSMAIDEDQNSIICADVKGNIEVWYLKGKLVDSFRMKGAVLDIEPIGNGDYLMGGWSGKLIKWHKTHLLADITMIPGGDYMIRSLKFGCTVSKNFFEKAKILYRFDEDELKSCAPR